VSSDHIDRVAGEPWFIFGEYPDGCVDVSDGRDDVFEHIPRTKAERLIKLRSDFLDAVRLEYEMPEPAEVVVRALTPEEEAYVKRYPDRPFPGPVELAAEAGACVVCGQWPCEGHD